MAAGIFEINSFVHKFVNLWQAGRNVSLKLDSKAGQASVTLHLDLGQAVPPQHVQNARDRRRQRRADARKSNAAEAANIMGANLVKESDLKVGATGKAVTNDEIVIHVDKAFTNDVEMSAENAEEAETKVQSFKCEECDKILDSAVDLRAHEVNKHRVTYSPIPQNDGACDLDARQPTYCKICEECPEEMKTSEDVNYHVMNNHATNLVYEKYGKLWVEERRYCIRKNSPFNKEI